jgi:hypothetical protein
MLNRTFLQISSFMFAKFCAFMKVIRLLTIHKKSVINPFHNFRVIAQWYSAGLRPVRLGVRVPVGAGKFSPHHRLQTDSGAHPASYPTGTRGTFPGGKTTRA